jgi:hypothetical protein
MGEVSLLALPIDHLGSGNREGRIAPFLNMMNKAKGNLVQPIVGRLVVVLVDERRATLQLIQDGIGEAKTQRYPVRKPGCHILQGGMEGLSDGLQVRHAKKTHSFLPGQLFQELTIFL